MMKHLVAVVSLSIGITCLILIQKNIPAWSTTPSLQKKNQNNSILIAENFPLREVSVENSVNVGLDEQLWHNFSYPNGDRASLITAIDNSLKYLNTPKAIESYQNYPVPGITLDRVRRSLLRFRELLLTAKSPVELKKAVQQEFDFYQSVGNDNQGTVGFTGYFQPAYSASRVPNSEYRYPLYRKPSNFDSWSEPHPTRSDLEGKDGLLGKKSILSGYELVWLRDRLEAFLVQVQGSAQLQLTDGTTMSVSYDGSTEYPYVSIGGELVKEGLFAKEELSLPKLIDYFQQQPKALDKYIPRNNRFIFFRETEGGNPNGSLGVPVTGDRSIATDKSIMPPGALALIVAPIPQMNQRGELESNNLVSRYVLDQDTGSAIKGAGRVDIFLGSGEIAGACAGLINGTGQLYYLLLKIN
jgi:membrane-bound lytic murein transglycosylase A